MMLGVIAKSQLAEELGISAGRVSQYLARGLPVEPDGRIVVAKAVAWLTDNVDPIRSSPELQAGLQRLRQRRDGPTPADAARVVVVASLTGLQELIGRFLADRGIDLPIAFVASRAIKLVLWEHLEGIAQQLGVADDIEIVMEQEAIFWNELAATRGVTFDPERWEAEALPEYADQSGERPS